jgi:hypothetical protein
MTGSELANKLRAESGSLLGRRVLSNRTLKNCPFFKTWGGIIGVGRNNRVDIRWADGTLSRNQYIGDYAIVPGDDYLEPKHRQVAIDRGYLKPIVDKLDRSRSFEEDPIL